MPPKHNKSKKAAADDSEEFQALLSQLSKATKSNGKEQQKERSKEDTLRKKKNDSHEALVKKNNTSDMEQYLQRQQQQRQLQAIFQQMMMASNRPHLNAPNTAFHGEADALPGKFEIGVGSMQGWRTNMEDAHVVDVKTVGSDSGLFAVFDGHAGDLCAKQSKVLFPALVTKHLEKDTLEVNFDAAFHELDAVLRGRLKDDSGCTACGVLITSKKVTCASVGDSRAVLCRGETAIDLSQDHKPDDDLEKLRIEAAGGHVESNRVNGQLAMSRAIGDYSYKQQLERGVDEQLVIAKPDVVSKDRTAEDRFVVVACDGIFDVLSNQELVDFINDEIKKDATQSLTKICEAVCNRCLAPVSATGGPTTAAGTDNMTVVIIKLL
ncbi:protein phosphatase 2C, putative [Bodo saltans]|uniref:Protein phosphatase 2C, putative n=1 Tax=Bodo saltans TaxID=75058 RepID=A0A0S4JPM8_BODSA|nr:protein phosphatase 2C, putative [Bodo saltans]|eukprot:CUG92193.1 protein phosphatase 2C, putative [Bodo saltans]